MALLHVTVSVFLPVQSEVSVVLLMESSHSMRFAVTPAGSLSVITRGVAKLGGATPTLRTWSMNWPSCSMPSASGAPRFVSPQSAFTSQTGPVTARAGAAPRIAVSRAARTAGVARPVKRRGHCSSLFLCLPIVIVSPVAPSRLSWP